MSLLRRCGSTHNHANRENDKPFGEPLHHVDRISHFANSSLQWFKLAFIHGVHETTRPSGSGSGTPFDEQKMDARFRLVSSVQYRIRSKHPIDWKSCVLVMKTMMRKQSEWMLPVLSTPCGMRNTRGPLLRKCGAKI